MLDYINDLMAENAELRRGLIATGYNVNRLRTFTSEKMDRGSSLDVGFGDESSEEHASEAIRECRSCVLLEKQLLRSTNEVDRCKDQERNVTMALEKRIQNLTDSLSRENKRRHRMESIIQRQQMHIRELTIKLRELCVPQTLADNQKADALFTEHEEEPWELDMDDLNRQLRELDDNVHRVENSTDRLVTSTEAAFEMPQYIAGIPRNPSSLLERMFNGSNYGSSSFITQLQPV